MTEIGADRKALVIRLVGLVRGKHPELTYDTVLAATTAAGIFPATLPNAYRNAIEIDLREFGEGTPKIFECCTRKIHEYLNRIDEGIKRDRISRLALFAFARIPLLVYLGAHLDDKIPLMIFQRQRRDDENAWCWPLNPPDPAFFQFEKVHPGDRHQVALILSISGTIHPRELPQDIQDHYTLYSVTPILPATSGPEMISI